MQELYDSIDLLMHPDGSFLEGPGYFFYTVGSIQPALQMYANARGKKLRDVIPEKMKNSVHSAIRWSPRTAAAG